MPRHRRRMRRSTVLFRAVGASLVAVALVVGVVALIDVANGKSGGSSAATPTRFAPPTGRTPADRPPTGRPPTAAPSTVLATPVATPFSLSPAPLPSSTAPAPSPAPAPGSAGSVVVYSASASAALVASAVAALHNAGYAVLRTRSVNLTVSTSTVYFDPGAGAGAHKLIAANVGVRQALLRPKRLIRTGTLIVVVTPSYVP